MHHLWYCYSALSVLELWRNVSFWGHKASSYTAQVKRGCWIVCVRGGGQRSARLGGTHREWQEDPPHLLRTLHPETLTSLVPCGYSATAGICHFRETRHQKKRWAPWAKLHSKVTTGPSMRQPTALFFYLIQTKSHVRWSSQTQLQLQGGQIGTRDSTHTLSPNDRGHDIISWSWKKSCNLLLLWLFK